MAPAAETIVPCPNGFKSPMFHDPGAPPPPQPPHIAVPRYPGWGGSVRRERRESARARSGRSFPANECRSLRGEIRHRQRSSRDVLFSTGHLKALGGGQKRDDETKGALAANHLRRPLSPPLSHSLLNSLFFAVLPSIVAQPGDPSFISVCAAHLALSIRQSAQKMFRFWPSGHPARPLRERVPVPVFLCPPYHPALSPFTLSFLPVLLASPCRRVTRVTQPLARPPALPSGPPVFTEGR